MRLRLTVALSFIILCALAWGASFVTNGRVIAQFDSIPANRVKQIEKDIASGYSPNDLIPTSVEFYTQTNDGVISGAMILDFIVSNNAAVLWGTLTNYSFPPNTTGSLSFHMCAIDAANTNGYFPCYTTNAFYQVKRFP